ncbi:hypothetical protein KIN20_028383 [Parelaphostrongylus tenuis]|uniref:Uncharacterized protein n=1 Tax=Parelaphostrongylus tenuis TaxID=148309 RepID=A0AAD5R1H9_PARTN|nr:hypothetical protein KIN20_028383 [Parelaphostrongylus tenuis]
MFEQLFEAFEAKRCGHKSRRFSTLWINLWSVLEEKVSATRCTSVDALKTALTRYWDGISVEMLFTIRCENKLFITYTVEVIDVFD